MKHEGARTAFSRLDGEVAALRRQVACSALFSWNFSARLRPVVEPVREEPIHLRAWHPLEILAACLAVCVALCACGGKTAVKRELTQSETEAIFDSGARHAFIVDLACEMQDGRIGLIIRREESQ